VKKDTGRLACEACGFDFEQRYGAIGLDYCEVHHRIAIASLDGQKATRLSDLAIVCSNCHRMLHKTKPMLTVEKLRKRLVANQVRA
jgi:5-methylcytosine-specific restriction enzyme A